MALKSHSFTGPPVPVSHHPLSKEILPNSEPKPILFNLKPPLPCHYTFLQIVPLPVSCRLSSGISPATPGNELALPPAATGSYLQIIESSPKLEQPGEHKPTPRSFEPKSSIRAQAHPALLQSSSCPKPGSELSLTHNPGSGLSLTPNPGSGLSPTPNSCSELSPIPNPGSLFPAPGAPAARAALLPPAGQGAVLQVRRTHGRGRPRDENRSGTEPRNHGTRESRNQGITESWNNRITESQDFEIIKPNL